MKQTTLLIIKTILLSVAITSPDTLQTIALDYQQGNKSLKDYAIWAETYRSDKPTPNTEWEYIDGWYVRLMDIKRTVTTVIEYLNGVCVSRQVKEKFKQEYGESRRAYPPEFYWVPKKVEPALTLDDILSDPNLPPEIRLMIESLEK